ncbi:Miniconductance mechanosensitive channel MscM precursor [Thalassoglobus neptunius]|uniref:Miniconductance mechanosensitive channel MscM n=1 Tax=Thalassoglobus neptunius TaxID=1938619 RepID=A0A5C5WYK8_9PLAN|nr:mechanosensitive ion channel domain-containing protein [Thalassoglobus neptunius]TWT55776.1 Miniconductance mechanosensitive channel MscM precursor [Thalassoglobus neptunius]
MQLLRIARWCCAFTFWWTISSSSLLAQPDETPAPLSGVQDPSGTSVSREVIDALRSRIESSTDLSEENKKTALENLDKALLSLAAAKDFAAREKVAKEALESIPERRANLQAELDRAQKMSPETPSETLELPELEQALAVKNSELVQVQSRIDKLKAAIDERTQRQRTVKDRLVAIPTERSELQTELGRYAEVDQGNLLEMSKYLSLLAARQKLDAEPTALQEELALSNAEEANNMLRLEQQKELLRVEILKAEVAKYSQQVNRARRSNARNRLNLARDQANAAKESEEPWSDALAAVYARTAEIVQTELEVQTSQQEVERELADVDQQIASLKEEFKQLQSREDRTGTSQSFGIRLRQQRSLLPSPSVLRSEALMRNEDYEEAYLDFFDYREERNKLDEIEDEINPILGKVLANDNLDTEEREAISKEIRTAFLDQRDALNAVIVAFDKKIEGLESYDAAQNSFANLSEQFAEYIDERVLWIRSHDPISLKGLTSDVASLHVLTDRGNWNAFFDQIRGDFQKNPVLYFIALLLWTILLFTRRRQTRRILETGKKAASRLNLSMKPTVQSFLMTTSKAAVAGAPFLFLGWRLSNAFVIDSNPQAFNQFATLGKNLITVGCIVTFLEFVRNVSRPSGLGVAHFGWSKDACKVLNWQTNELIFFLVPLTLVIAILDAWKVVGDSETIVRLITICAYLILAAKLYRLTNPHNGVATMWSQPSSDGWLDRFLRIFHVLAIAFPIAMSLLTAMGFYYATHRITMDVLMTIAVFFLIVFSRAIMFRWLTLRQRRLALEESRLRRAAKTKAEEAGAAFASIAPETEEQKSNLAEVSSQTRRLLNTTLTIMSIFIIWNIWSDVLPALQYFDEWTLPGTDLGLPRLVSAVFVAALAATAAKNVPGLLEITLLEWLPLEKSSRYAIGAITQYLIAIFGVLLVSVQLEIGWEKVQWLAAALTFGLGFGLQEIFANFVSGLIILFEQPVRLGDIVTIDQISGSVTKIRIRATTITDWDRKEYIVPNREFITGKLLNWTLTDSTNRIVIEVGVAYGSDPELVQRIILKCAENHPRLLREPPPVVVMDRFADSSLNFTLRGYLPNLEFRLLTIHELHVAINNEFAKEGIEIPFPQRDLHIRSTVNLPVQNESQKPLEAPTAIPRSGVEVVDDAESNGEA